MCSHLFQVPTLEFGTVPVPEYKVKTLYSGTWKWALGNPCVHKVFVRPGTAPRRKAHVSKWCLTGRKGVTMYTVTLSGTQGVNTTIVCAGFLILFPGRRHPICNFFFLRRRSGGDLSRRSLYKTTPFWLFYEALKDSAFAVGMMNAIKSFIASTSICVEQQQLKQVEIPLAKR